MKTILLIALLLLVVAFLGWVRLAPNDPARWHVAPKVDGDRNGQGSARRLVAAGPDGLARLDAVARNWPRTRVLAGSVDAGMVTYITRTKVIGFPDYTTVQQDGNQLKIYARLRFGRSDLGVNAARVDAWVKALHGAEG